MTNSGPCAWHLQKTRLVSPPSLTAVQITIARLLGVLIESRKLVNLGESQKWFFCSFAILEFRFKAIFSFKWIMTQFWSIQWWKNSHVQYWNAIFCHETQVLSKLTDLVFKKSSTCSWNIFMNKTWVQQKCWIVWSSVWK